MLRILFASQSGSAEEYAERIAHEAYMRGLDYNFGCLNGIDIADIDPANDIIIIACSTTGDGEMPVNGRDFWHWLLQSTLPTDLFLGFTFAILALGDSSYEKFNYAGKMLHRRIEQLGGSLLVDRADADEQHPFGHDGVFTTWSETLWKQIDAKYPQTQIHRLDKSQPKVRLEFVELSQNYGLISTNMLPINATVVKNTRITSEDHFQDVRHLEFVLEGDPSTEDIWLPGDVATLMPWNDDDLVEETMEAFGWKNDDLLPLSPFIIHPNRPEFRFPWSGLEGSPVTLGHLLKYHLDIRKPPRRSFFRILAQVAREQMNKINDDCNQLEVFVEKLEELSSPDGLDLYLSFVWRPKRMAHEVLNDFSLLRGLIPIDWIFDLFPWIHPREYSISSSPVSPSSSEKSPLSVTAALVQYTSLKSLPERWGLCSRWLNQTQVGSKLTLNIRPGSWREAIRSDLHSNRPWIMIAAGSGVAPMRALTQHESCQNHDRRLYLFFGCRYIEKDFLYKDEWHSYSDHLQVFAMGSRDQGGSRRHLPVLLKQHADILSRLLIEEEARVFVAGNSKLPRLIKETINEIGGDPDLSDALIRLDRLHIEAWS